MKTIVLAASKGGVGKTTLAAALSVAAVEDGARVALIDADPQQSFAMWHEARGDSDNLVLVGDRDESVVKRNSRAEEEGFDLCIVDSPPAMVGIIEPCIRIASLVIIPSRPSPLDLMAIDPIVELCDEHQKPSLFVLNQTLPRSVHTEQAAKMLRKKGLVWDGEITARQGYAIAMTRGLTLPELEKGNGAAREEITSLWSAVKRKLGRVKGPRS